jgi:hypothetical protein
VRIPYCLLLTVLLIVPPVHADEPLSFTGSGTPKAYLPGDVVHVVVASPPDTVKVVTVMPDSKRLELDFERRTYSWHAYWEVPFGFKKGTYNAKIMATDVEGRMFEGVTGNFYIGEPALVTMIGRQVSAETGGNGEKELIKKMQAEIAYLYQAMKERPAATELTKVMTKTVPRPTAAARRSKVNLSARKAALVARAKAYLDRGDYERAQTQLTAAARLDPNDRPLGAFLGRLRAIVKARAKE